jgi:hypothetical protein
MNAASAVGPAAGEELKVHYATDPDREKAGQGLATTPFARQAVGQGALMYWMMSPAEQAALLYLLEWLRPEVAIEIGTRFGGSLQALSKYCRRVYSLDIDPEVPGRLAARFPNVAYRIGPSDRTLPALLEELQASGQEVAFALVDGDHTTEGVRKDIEALLRYRPVVPFFIIMHDSFNPACRKALRLADWAGSPYVHAVELDFVMGTVNPAPAYWGQLWGGLCLAYLQPQPRQGHFEVTARGELTFQAALAATRPSALRSGMQAAVRSVRRRLSRIKASVRPGPR